MCEKLKSVCKKMLGFVILNVKKDAFRVDYGIFIFFSDFGCFKKCYSHLSHSLQKSDLKTFIAPSKSKIYIWTFIGIVTSGDRELTLSHQGLSRCLEVS